jgi:hypothetical protein
MIEDKIYAEFIDKLFKYDLDNKSKIEIDRIISEIFYKLYNMSYDGYTMTSYNLVIEDNLNIKFNFKIYPEKQTHTLLINYKNVIRLKKIDKLLF